MSFISSHSESSKYYFGKGKVGSFMENPSMAQEMVSYIFSVANITAHHTPFPCASLYTTNKMKTWHQYILKILSYNILILIKYLLCAWYRSEHSSCINLLNFPRDPIWVEVILSDYQFYLTDEEVDTELI